MMTNDIWAQLEEEGKIIKEQKEQITDLVAALEGASAWFNANYSYIEHDADAIQLTNDIDTALGKEE